MSKENVDLSDPSLQRWIGTITKKNTLHMYKIAFEKYEKFTGLNATQLIQEALEDMRRDPQDKKDIVLQRLLGFYNWLLKECPKGKPDPKNPPRFGLSPKMANTCVQAVRSFYSTYDVYVKLKGRSKLPNPHVENPKMILSNMEVKRLVDNTRTIRDRAIILTLFQSGLDVSTLCSLKYGDISEGLAKDEHPLILRLYREKASTEFYTFIGKDSVESIKAYLNDLKSKGIILEANSPLFMKESNKALMREGISPFHVQNMMRDVAIRSGFVDEKLNGRDQNPLSPHALRESFSSIMLNKGMPDSVIDFMLGHMIGQMSQAYKTVSLGEIKKMYAEREPFISVGSGEDVSVLRKEMSDNHTILNSLIEQNASYKNRIETLEKAIGELPKIKELVDDLIKKKRLEMPN
jgi:integrase/recombinase XerD